MTSRNARNHVSFCVAAILGLSICASGSVLAQAPEPPRPSDVQTAQAQDQFQRDKATLADQAHRSVDAADANIDALRNRAKSEHGDLRKQHEDEASRLSMLKDHVNAGIHKMDKASINDWDGLRPVVDRDLAALNDALRKAAPITHIPLPADMGP